MKQKTFNRLQTIAHDYLNDGFYIACVEGGEVELRITGSNNLFEPHKNTSQAIRLAGHYDLTMGMERGSGSRSGLFAIVESMHTIARVPLDMTTDLGAGYEKALRKAIVRCVADTIREINEDEQ